MALPPGLSQIPGLQPDAWKQAELHERIAALQTAEFQLADSQERPRCTVSYFEGQPEELGRLDRDNPVEIGINKNSLTSETPDQALKTVAHEGRHAYQLDCVKSPDNHPEADAVQVEQWRENYKPGNYTPPDVDFDEYRNQPVEADAYQYADEVKNSVYPQMATEQESQNTAVVETGSETMTPGTPPIEPDSTAQSWKHDLGEGIADRSEPPAPAAVQAPEETVTTQAEPMPETATSAEPIEAPASAPSWQHDLGDGLAEREPPAPPPPPTESESMSM